MLIPDNIKDFNSQGENLLYNKFKRELLSEKIYILHSVFIQHHLNKISGEIDFLVLIPNHGIFAIEVKHGGVSRNNGVWQYQNRFGKVSKTDKSPFSQVSASMHSIRKYIDVKLDGEPEFQNKFKKILWGTGIALTSLDEIPDIGQEGFSWQIFSRRNLFTPIHSYLDNLSNKWHKEYSTKQFYDFHNSRPSIKDCEKIIKIIRGDFDIDYSPLNRLLNNELQIKQFTEEQFGILSFVEINQRNLIQGAAGTGKTILAIEQTRRLIEKQMKVGFICFNQKLGEHFSKIFKNGIQNNYVADSFHSFISKGIKNINELQKYKDNQAEFFEFILPTTFLLDNNLDEEEKFDYLIIDEAQDLINNNYLDVFDSILKGGLANGNFSFYGDFSNQAIFNNSKNNLIDILKSRAYFSTVPELTINCRNTRKISYQNTLLTGAKKPSNYDNQIDGERVIIERIEESVKNNFLFDEIQKLVTNKIDLTNISILSFKKIENSSLIQDSRFIAYLKKGLTISTVQSYKGLENSIVFLVDFPEIAFENILNLLYVGISRAKIKLIILLNSSSEKQFNHLIQKTISQKL